MTNEFFFAGQTAEVALSFSPATHTIRLINANEPFSRGDVWAWMEKKTNFRSTKNSSTNKCDEFSWHTEWLHRHTAHTVICCCRAIHCSAYDIGRVLLRTEGTVREQRYGGRPKFRMCNKKLSCYRCERDTTNSQNRNVNTLNWTINWCWFCCFCLCFLYSSFSFRSPWLL